MKHTNNYWIKKIQKIYPTEEGYSYREWCTPRERGVYIQDSQTWKRIIEAWSRESLYLKIK
jgi:hypothetical protein